MRISLRSLGTIILLNIASSAYAQAVTSFNGGANTAIEYRGYPSPDACLAAIQRLRNTADWDAERDTMPMDSSRHDPSTAIAAARRCAPRFDVDSVLEKSLNALQQVALAANDDRLAARVVQRRIRLAERRQPTERNMIVLDAVIDEVNAMPARFAQADTLVAHMDSVPADAQRVRLWAQGAVVHAAIRENDVPRATYSATRWLAMLRRLPLPQREVMAGEGSFMLALVLRPRNDPFSLAEAARYRDTMATLFGAAIAERVVGMVGRAAPLVAGEHRYHTSSVDTGSSLVVFLEPRCGGNCGARYAVLCRIAARFGPALRMTTVVRTSGYLQTTLFESPANESVALERYLDGYFSLPGALTVETTPFTKRPPPDRRRVNGAVPTAEHYQVARSFGVTMFLIDRHGYIVWPPITVSREQETWLGNLIAGVFAAP